MKRTFHHTALFCFILLTGTFLRLYKLDERPMHADEAVQALRFANLLDEKVYRYDRHDFHGPVLDFATLIIAKARNIKEISQMDEITLRLVPVIFSMFTILLLLFLVPVTGWSAVHLAALLMAVSPALLYYNRFFIHESLLAFFNFGLLVSVVKFLHNGKKGWMLMTGIFMGLMISTKETWIIHIGAMTIAGILTWSLCFRKSSIPGLKRFTAAHLMTFIFLPALIIPLFLYSSFFKNPDGLTEAIRALVDYSSRAVHDPDHLHPWYFYLYTLSFPQRIDGFFWSELWILLLSLTGAIWILNPRNNQDPSIIYIAVYGLVLTTLYSAIPYKTPWILINFYLVLIFPAAIASGEIIHKVSFPGAKSGFMILIAIFFVLTIRQSWEYINNGASDVSNPYAYSQTTTDIFEISGTIHELSGRQADGKNMYIEIIFKNSEYWPLPWYLRDLKRTGWWDHVDMDTPPAGIVLASPDTEPDLLKKWYEVPPPGERHLYVPLFEHNMYIRQGVEIRGYIRQDLIRGSRGLP